MANLTAFMWLAVTLLWFETTVIVCFNGTADNGWWLFYLPLALLTISALIITQNTIEKE